MSLEIQLREYAKESGIKSPRALGIKAAIPYAVAMRYWQGGEMERVNLAILATIAKTMGVPAKDLIMEYEDDTKTV